MKSIKFLAVAVLALTPFIGSAKAEMPDDAVVVAYSGGLGAMAVTTSAGLGPAMFLGGLAAIAYCQSEMKKDASGYVVYQSPKCNGGSAVPVVGNLTQNPYNKVGKKCLPLPQGGYNCEN